MCQEHVATDTKQSSDTVHVYTQCAMTRTEFIGRERKELTSWEFDIAVLGAHCTGIIFRSLGKTWLL